jgi:hypothetical protein
MEERSGVGRAVCSQRQERHVDGQPADGPHHRFARGADLVILVFGVLAAQGIHIASMHLPFMQTILGTEPVRFTQWVLLLSLAMVIALVMENVANKGCMRCPMESGRDGFALELVVQRTRTAQEQG